MKILLSAYACEPDKGSEPGVGWHWALELSRLGHQVWVITRANNQIPIENALSDIPCNLHFEYYDLPQWIVRWKKLPGGVYFYYLLWQIGAYLFAKSLIKQTNFDWVHHITFGVLRMPSLMAFLGVPFIFGPLGGGETSPKSLRSGFPLRGYILDWLRDFSNWLVSIDPLLHSVYRRSTIILCKTPETMAAIPPLYRDKCRLYLEIGTESSSRGAELKLSPNPQSDGEFRLLYVGRLVYWKGLHLGLQAFARLLPQMPNSRLTVIGEGKDADWLHSLAAELKINNSIDWIDWLPQREVLKFYTRHDTFLFPSLHDSSGNVVLEALSSALPVVCLDIGGPGVMIDNSCGRAINTKDLSSASTVEKLSQALLELAGDRNLRRQLSRGASIRSQNYYWHKIVDDLYTTL